MSNFCEVCKRPYPDELAACPHCEGAVELTADDVEIVEEAPEAGQEVPMAFPVEPDSAVDLGVPALPTGSSSGQGTEGSGISVVEWASLVEAEPKSSAPAPALFDDPADADLLPAEAVAAAPTEPTPARPPAKDDEEDALAADLDAVRSIFSGDASASFSRHVPTTTQAAPPAGEEDDSALDLLAPNAGEPALASEASPPPVAEPVPLSAHEQAVEAADSGVDLTAADLEGEMVADAVGEPSADSALVDLTGADVFAEEPVSAGSAAVVDSSIDLSEFVVQEAPGESGVNLDEPVGIDGASSVRRVAADSGIEVVDILPPQEAAPEEWAAVEIVDSGVALGGPGPADDPLSDEAVIASTPSDESAINLDDVIVIGSSANMAGAPLVEEPVSDVPERAVRPISDGGLDLSGDDLEAAPDSDSPDGIEENTPDTSESGRDLIAEEVESGVNLRLESFGAADAPAAPGTEEAQDLFVDESGTSLAAGQLASEAEEVDLTEMSAAEIDSSAVDLGASATFPVAPSEVPSAPAGAEGTEPYEAQSKSIHGGEEIAPSEVNLGGRHDGAGDYFEESEGLGGSGGPIEMVDEQAAGLDMSEEPVEAADEEFEAVEPEPVAEDEAEEPAERPARPAKPTKERRRSGAGAWLVGAVMGGLAATGVCLGLWLFNIEPPRGWHASVAGLTGATVPPAANTNTTGNPGNGTTAPVGLPATPADKMAMVRSGDLDKAKQANVETADETKSDELAARGEYRVRSYLQQASANKAPIKPDDPALLAGMKDLETASKDNADALFYLAVAREETNDLAGAQKTYAEGMERYKNDPAQRERFEAGLNRVTAAEAGRPAGVGRAAPDRAVLLALLLTGLEPPAAPPAPPAGGAAAPAEAGSAFWKAVRLAHDQQYADAIKALDQAEDVHVKRRFTVLGKAQNPNSDPTEEIFLRSCEELKAYWQLQEKLRGAGYLNAAKGQDAPKAVDALLAQNKDLADKLAKAGTDADALKKNLDTATKDLDESKKEAETAKKDLETTKKDLDAAKLDLTAKANDLAASEKNAADLTAKLKAAGAAVAKKDETLKGVADALRPRFVKPEADDAAVLAGVKEATRIASIADPGDQIRELERQTAGLKRTLGQRWTPEQMLGFWLPLMRERGRRDLADHAITDADRVLDDDAATPADKARALTVRGMALRDEEKYDDAKADLERAKKELPVEDGEWLLETETALAEADDPSAWFASRAEAFRREGRPAQALALLGRALETAGPAVRARLLVERGTWRLDDALARGKGRIAADDPDLPAAHKDAEDAGGAEALYLSGRIAEELGQLDTAIDDYRQALNGHGALDADGARYRAALARVLVQPRPAKPAEGGKVGKAGPRPSPALLAALLTIGLQPADLPGEVDPDTKAALKLADEILSAKAGDVPFEARAQALAVKGRWTEALITYVEGLRPSLGTEHAAGLMRIVQGHPNLRQPSILTAADPLAAETHYAAGLRWYFDRQYPKAEKEFFDAVENDGLDARYYYFLGLARLMQGDRDASEDFEQGARLERQNRPSRTAVSAALERVQGSARTQLNDVRDRPR